MLTAYAATTCLMQSSIGIIVAAPGGRSLLLEAFEDCCQVAIHNQRGPRPEFRNHTIKMLTKPESAATTSMLRDMLKNGRIEADHIVGDIIARAREAGVSTPILQTAFTRLKCYEAQRDGSSGAGSSIPQ
jgi:2-dehydropantoate 2-reductase